MSLLLAGLVIFLGVHSISLVNRGWRDAMVARLGAGPWKGLYSLASLAGFILLVQGYAATRAAPVILYNPPDFLHLVMLVVMLPVFPLLFAVYLPGHIRVRAKHPMLLATKLWATGHLLVNGTLADVLLFGSLLAWAVALRISLKRQGQVAPRPPAHGTRNDLMATVLGFAAYGAFLAGVHQWLVGVSIL